MSSRETSKQPPQLEALPDQELAKATRALWPKLRDATATTFAAFLGEAHVFSLLRRAGVAFLRALEGAPVDGALAHSFNPSADIEEFPPTAYHDIEHWSQQHPGVHFVTFDVKYVSLLNARSQYLDYDFSNPRFKGDVELQAEFFIVVFEGVYDHVAILPSETWLRARGSPSGPISLVSGVPLWCQPFMVAVEPLEDLKAACDSMLLAAVNKGTYENPTTTVRLAQFRPQATRTPPLGIQPDPAAPLYVSEEKYFQLWSLIGSVGGRVRLNPIAPLYFDFTVDLPGIGALRFEHKYAGGNQWISGAWNKDPGRRSCFAAQRIWHVVWIDLEDGKIIVVTRDEVTEGFLEHRHSKAYIETNHVLDDFATAMAHVRIHAAAARRAADEALRNVNPGDVDMDLILNTNGRHKKRLSESHEENSGGRIRLLQIGLPWLCPQLNQLCRNGRYGLIFPLEMYHPQGNHVMVHYEWTEDDVNRYDKYGKLPRAAYSRDLCQSNTRCIVLRLQDHSIRPGELGTGPNVGSTDRHSPLVMRHDFWWKLVEHESGRALPFLLVGSMLDKEILREATHRSSWYVLLPSEFTTMKHSDDLRPPPKAELKARGGHMFLASPPEYKRPPMPVSREGPSVFTSPFVIDGVNPMRYVVNLQDTIYDTLCKILRTSGSVSIPNPQSTSPNRSFNTTAYHTTLPAVHNSAWTFGFARPVRLIGTEDENTLAPLGTKFKIMRASDEKSQEPDNAEDKD